MEKLFALYISLDENLANECRTKMSQKMIIYLVFLVIPNVVFFVEKRQTSTVVESYIKDQVNNMYNPYTWLPSMINDSPH